ncbi:UNVERIFIED_CONTAM: hypothetical protein FKN15_002539 [Acipenser sinensis]
MESVHPNPAPIRWVVSENREVRIKEEPVPCCDPPGESVPVPQYGLVYMQQQYSRAQTEQNHTTHDQTYIQQGPSASVPSTYAEDHSGSQHPVIKEETSETECTPRPDPPHPGILRVSRFDLERGSTRFKFLRQNPSLRAVVRDTEQRPVHIKVEVYEPGGDVKEEEEERQCDSVNQEEEACVLEPGQIKVEDPEPDSVPETRRSVRIGEEAPEQPAVSSMDSGQVALSSMESGQPAALLGIGHEQSVHNIAIKGQTLVCNFDDGLTSTHSVGVGCTTLLSSDNGLTAMQNTGSGQTAVLGIDGGQSVYNIDKGKTLVHNFDNGHTSVRCVVTAAPGQRSSHSNQAVSPLEMPCNRGEETVPTDKLDVVRGDADVAGSESVLNQYRAPGLHAVSLQKDDPNYVSQLASACVKKEAPQEESVRIETEVPQAACVKDIRKEVHANGERQLDSTHTGNDVPLVESVYTDQEKVPEPNCLPPDKQVPPLNDSCSDNSLPPVESVHHTVSAPEPVPDCSDDVSAMDTDPAEKEEEGGEKEGSQISDDPSEPRSARSDVKTPDPHGADETEMESDLENDDPGPDSVVIDKKVHETGSLHPNEKTSEDIEVPDPKTFGTNAPENQDGKIPEKREKAAGREDDPEPQSLLRNCVIAESHACPHCPTAFPASQDLDKHMKKLHGEERAEKRRTRPVSSRRTSLRSSHTSQSQAQNPGPADAGTDKNLGKHSCADCGERFPTPKTLKKHRDTHQEAPCHPCKECSKTFRDPELLKRHRLVHRETEAAYKGVRSEGSRGEDPFGLEASGCGPIQLCGVAVGNLKRHQQIHAGSAPYQCPECQRRFNHAENLKRHRLVHVGETLHPCPECNTSFRSAAHLSKHRGEQHSEGQRRILRVCEDCGKSFKRAGDYHKHCRIHTGEKPYPCTECQKRFNHLGNLKKHLLVHSGETPFECPDCGKKFSQKGNMKKHRRTHNNDQDNAGKRKRKRRKKKK